MPDPPVIPGWKRFSPVAYSDHPEGVLIWTWKDGKGNVAHYPYIKDDTEAKED